jgi:hypothetical protein
MTQTRFQGVLEDTENFPIHHRESDNSMIITNDAILMRSIRFIYHMFVRMTLQHTVELLSDHSRDLINRSCKYVSEVRTTRQC